MNAKKRVNSHNSRKGTNGKAIGAKHNDRNFNLDSPYASHIDSTKSSDNTYWLYQEVTITDATNGEEKQPSNFEEYEQAVYEKFFGDYLASRNEKAIKSRHKDRVQTMEQFRKNMKACAEESIFTVGNRDNQTDAETLTAIFEKYVEWHKEQFPNVMLLDAALHVDEASPHIQIRRVWTAHDGDMLIINQEKALAEMGIERPDISKKVGRRNNAKMTYTAMCRQKQIELAKEFGIDVEEEPQEPSLSGRDLVQYQLDTLRVQYKELESRVEILTERANREEQRANDAEERANKAEEIAMQALVNLLSNIPPFVKEPYPAKPELPEKYQSQNEPVNGYPNYSRKYRNFDKELERWRKERDKVQAKIDKVYQKMCDEVDSRNEQARAEWEVKYLTADNLRKAKQQIEEQEQRVEPILQGARQFQQSARADREQAKKERELLEKERSEHDERVQEQAQSLARKMVEELLEGEVTSRIERLEKFCEGILFDDGMSALDKFEGQENDKKRKIQKKMKW